MNEHLMKNWLKYSQEVPSKPHPFNSSSERVMKTPKQSNPGPGAYNPPIKDVQRTSKYRVVRQIKSPIDPEFQWMFSQGRDSGLTHKSNNVLLGPGAYNVSEQQMMLKNSWSKASRFKTVLNSIDPDSPGPGYYESSPKSQSVPGAQFVFKSKLKKQLQLTKPKQPALTFHSPEKLRDPDIEDISQAQHKTQTKRVEQKSSFFASKVPRFLTESGLNYVGPGSYDIQKPTKTRIKTELPRMVRFKPAKAPMFRGKASSHLGPGSYNMSKYNLSRELEFKGYPVSRQTRFNFSGKKCNSGMLPGPGSYMQNKYVYINEEELLRRKMNKKTKNTSQIWSKKDKQERTVFTKSKIRQSSGPGLYNINAFDIQFRMRKKLEHVQKLKLMNIAVPPFNSNVPRLTK